MRTNLIRSLDIWPTFISRATSEAVRRHQSKTTSRILSQSFYIHSLGSFLAVNHHNNKSWVKSILTNNLWLIFMGMKQFFCFLKKKFNMADSKKLSFSTTPKAEQFLPKFHGLVLGVVRLIDAKGIDLAQPIWPSGCLT